MTLALIDHYGSRRLAALRAGTSRWTLDGITKETTTHVKFATEDGIRRAFAAIDRLPSVSLPTEPLAALLRERGLSAYAFFGPHSAVERALVRGRISFGLADLAASSLGVHPGSIWNDAYWTAA